MKVFKVIVNEGICGEGAGLAIIAADSEEGVHAVLKKYETDTSLFVPSELIERGIIEVIPDLIYSGTEPKVICVNSYFE
jgi:hypothetical protein